MARLVTKKEARRLRKQHRDLLSELRKVVKKPDEYAEVVKKNIDKLINKEMFDILRDIPVEELNKDRIGLRVRALRRAGYNNVEDVYRASRYSIGYINGVSMDMAGTIKNIANSFADKARKDTRIRLSVDSKTSQTTAVVSAIYLYKTSKAIANDVANLLYDYEQQIQYSIEDMRPLTTSLKWLFLSSKKKRSAEAEFEKLKQMLETEYGNKANNALKRIRGIESITTDVAWNDFADNSIEYFTIIENVYPGIISNEEDVYGLPEGLAQAIQDECFFPDGLKCTLRRYQEWGVKYALHQGKVILGDEMGLGKTVQAIATMVSLRNIGAKHFMVVCPASVLPNWCREIKEHSLLSVVKIHGRDKIEALKSWREHGGVAVTTFETTKDVGLADDFNISLLVVDEAHYIKNPKAARSQNVRRVSKNAERVLFMTGTALENNVKEMLSLIKIIRPDIANVAEDRAFMSTAPKFRELIAPVYYRRKREQVLAELPELIENKEWCTMSLDEIRVYERTVFDKNMMAMRRVSWNIDDVKQSSKARRLLEIIEEAKNEDRKIIVFSYFLDTLRAVRELLGAACTDTISGALNPQQRQEVIDGFETAPAGTVLPAQILSGGTGLNIQSASVVVICEPQYKPSIENQAISRAYRMGQSRNVLVHRLLCEDSVDERITEILKAKQAEFDAFADESVAAQENIELDDKSCKNIIEEEIERIKAKNGIIKDNVDSLDS